MKKRNVEKIKIWMLRKKISQADIIRATNEEQTYVNKTINGKRNNRKALAYLVDKGCPVSYLALPKDMENAA